ncbi:54S ribosomal protein yml6, mitochondrial [Elasticomyces elasticus]|nr:54S ribosomal protein yml6, mitochondrial [Elasticomyces elasticus]
MGSLRLLPRPAQVRSMATIAPSSTLSQTQAYVDANISTPSQSPRNPFITTATLTTHAFPSFEPTSFASYPSTHLLLPLRKDILHRAVIYEGDSTRQGTASTKYRSEVHGSNRKIRPQKGTGSARLGDKKSPMLKGGGVAFGPHPRDFSTDLPRKVYDLAWRTALSYRYKKGELILLEDQAEIEGVHEHSAERYLKDLTLFVTRHFRENLFTALEGEGMGREARAEECGDVDVKDLLELGRLVMEKSALERILSEHQTDLAESEKLHSWSKEQRTQEKRESRKGHFTARRAGAMAA